MPSMISKKMFLLHALAIVCAFHVSSATEAVLDLALETDDQCQDNGLEQNCALNALQHKAKATLNMEDAQSGFDALIDEDDDFDDANLEKHFNMTELAQLAKQFNVDENTESEESESGGGCHTGIMAQVFAVAPGCFRACPQLCSPVGWGLNRYLGGGGIAGAWKVFCHYKSRFNCGLSRHNYRKCVPLIRKAAGFGVRLPNSVGALNHKCRR
eukprot:TRINITY_DN82423_c0_g1_i1.p1 TRINITY_DN82423_c0_g1~~TRINITY_DN82423_c0_g1_i1.p1  ORF type:complete len:213 (+),score=37.88 TRINITY_DN82423_c0_g1_i1:118-756(+)